MSGYDPVYERLFNESRAASVRYLTVADILVALLDIPGMIESPAFAVMDGLYREALAADEAAGRAVAAHLAMTEVPA